MAIIEEQVKHAVELSRLPFSEEELADSINQLDKIIDMVESLEETDTARAPFTSDANESINVMCGDATTSEMDRKGLVRSIPEPKNSYIKAPAIMDSGGAGV